MAGSEQVYDPRTAKKMASRIRLRKKKFHLPMQEPPDHPNVKCKKIDEEPEKINRTKYFQAAQPRLIPLKIQRKQT